MTQLVCVEEPKIFTSKDRHPAPCSKRLLSESHGNGMPLGPAGSRSSPGSPPTPPPRATAVCVESWHQVSALSVSLLLTPSLALSPLPSPLPNCPPTAPPPPPTAECVYNECNPRPTTLTILLCLSSYLGKMISQTASVIKPFKI